jgi:hypothetical protein
MIKAEVSAYNSWQHYVASAANRERIIWKAGGAPDVFMESMALAHSQIHLAPALGRCYDDPISVADTPGVAWKMGQKGGVA